jgi:hypothetical protein
MPQKSKMTLEQAELGIKTFIASRHYESPTDAAREARRRRLVFALNYADECGGSYLSSIILELEGSPSKGTIAARVNTGYSTSQVIVSSITNIGHQEKEPTEKEVENVKEDLITFIKKAGIPTKTTGKLASEIQTNDPVGPTTADTFRARRLRRKGKAEETEDQMGINKNPLSDPHLVTTPLGER